MAVFEMEERMADNYRIVMEVSEENESEMEFKDENYISFMRAGELMLCLFTADITKLLSQICF